MVTQILKSTTELKRYTIRCNFSHFLRFFLWNATQISYTGVFVSLLINEKPFLFGLSANQIMSLFIIIFR